MEQLIPYVPTVMPENYPAPLSASELDDYYESIFPGWKAAHHPPTWEEDDAEEEYEGQYGESQWQTQERPIEEHVDPAYGTQAQPAPVLGVVPAAGFAPPIVAPWNPVPVPLPSHGIETETLEASHAMANEFGHTLLRSDGPTDIYYLVDEAGIPIYWAVAKGADSRAMLEGSLARDEPTPQTNYGVQSEPAHSSGGYVDPAHRWVGYDAAGNDVYRLTDSDGAVLEWSVRRGDDSRAMLGGSLKNLSAGQQSTATPRTPSRIIDLGAVIIGALTTNPPGINATPSGATPSNTTPSNTTPNVTPSNRFNPSHVLVGYDRNGNDVYQLVDEAGTVVEWAVKHGDDSRAVIAGTIRNIGPGSPTQAVSTSRTTIPGATTTPAAGIAGTIASSVSIPQLVTAGIIALLTR